MALLTNGLTSARHRLDRGAKAVADGSTSHRSILDAREAEVLRLLSLGLTNRQIAERICYSQGTVKNVVQCIIEKLGVSDRGQAAEILQAGLKNGSVDSSRQ